MSKNEGKYLTGVFLAVASAVCVLTLVLLQGC